MFATITIITMKMMTQTMNIALIHTGLSTQNQLQLIRLVTFRVMKTIWSKPQNPIPVDEDEVFDIVLILKLTIKLKDILIHFPPAHLVRPQSFRFLWGEVFDWRV